MKKQKVKKKKRTKRSLRQYPALDPSVNLKTRMDLIDYDYINKLSDKEKEWLNKFTEEYTIASFKKNEKHLHKKAEQKRDAYNRNNSRNRCIYTKSKAFGNLDYIEDLKEKMEDEFISYEDGLIDVIDEEKELLKKLNNLNNTSNKTKDNGDKSN